MWVIGLTLGVVAGAGTAMLLMPGNEDPPVGGRSVAEAWRSR